MANKQARVDHTNAGGELGGTSFGQQPGEAVEKKRETKPDPTGKKTGDRQPGSDADTESTSSR